MTKSSLRSPAMLRLVLHGILSGLLLGTVYAENVPEPSRQTWRDQPIAIPSLQKDIRSGNTGRTYRIFIHVPSAPAPEKGFPILYLLDGNATYPAATLLLESMLERAPGYGITPGIVVGIGYPVETAISAADRIEDYTPPAADLSATGDVSGHPQGGADRFLDFIEKELKPQLAKDHKIDPARQTLFGHSYGGLFTLHALFTRPDGFQRYFAASPSIWWNQRHILTEKNTFLNRKNPADTSILLRLTVGSEEQLPSPRQQANQRTEQILSRRQVDNARELSAKLRASGINSTFVLFEDENHGSARFPAINQALRFAFSAPSQKPAPDR